MTAQPRLLGGRYQIGELLGYGGMAEVHRGRDLRLGRDVAVKMLRTDLARDETFQMRFRREAQNAASLNHPAIVAVYDTGEEQAPTGEKLPFIVMEFVNGRTLKEVLAVEGRLMPRRALEITADICAALDFSHRHGIIHRDIKPGNVMLTQNGQVKVMDFGIARALASGATTMTQTSAVIGTAQYLSPEQARGEAVDARSDVYATGCVVYELLTGHPPFVGDNPVSVAYQHVREDARPPSDSNRDVPPDIDAVVLKALAKNPMNRYQSAGEMRADLLRAASGRPVYATPVLRDDEVESTIPMAPRMPAGGRPAGARNTGTMSRVNDRRRRASSWAIAALTALGVLAVVALTVGLILANQPRQVLVPTLTGKSKQDAQAEAIRNNLRLVVASDAVYNSTCKLDTVMAQDPQANSRVQQNTEVRVRLCGGPATTKVPVGLLGNTRENAEQLLREAKLRPKANPVDSDKPAGEVVKVSPAQGTPVAENTEVILDVSNGKLKKVPNVVGLELGAAKEILDNAGFRVNVKMADVNDPDKVGRVVSQDPAKDALKTIGTTVVIVVGEEPEPPVPTPSASDG
ncbi:MAG TPA: Stk1 family PASTA domain-containing Ser/Thr kinase [Micromonosporaceae bacterium]|nr:Stk1 family PASTA domain-containing Ser/Thr kinase [Micromonosporaceae bacterium]